MKSTEPLNLSTKSFNLESHSATSKSLISQQDANSLSSKPELVTREMPETSTKVENNGCDTKKHTVEVHVHQVNGYSSGDDGDATCLRQQESSKSVETCLGLQKPSKSVETCLGLQKPSNSVETCLGQHKPSNSVETCLGLQKPSNSVETCLGQQKPSNSVETCLGLQKPSNSVETCLGQQKPSNSVETCLGQLKPSNSVETCLGQQKPSNSVETCLGQQKPSNSVETCLGQQKLLASSNCVLAMSGEGMNHGSVNIGHGSDVKMDHTKIKLTSRDSAVFDVDLTIDDDVKDFEDVSDPSRLVVEENQQIPVKINGLSLVNGEDSHLQASSRCKEIKTVCADVEQSQKNDSSIFSTDSIRENFKSMKETIAGCNGLINNVQTTSAGDSVLANGVLQQDNVGVSKYLNGSNLAKASSFESLSDNGGGFERDLELRRSKSSISGFCSGRSRSDPDEDLDDLLLPGGRQRNEGYLPVDSGVESAASSWDRMAEVKESAHARLQEELRRAYHKLKLKDEEVSRLSRIRNEVEAELEELTASLFQEAHNMVREANVQQAAAEKALKESHMQIDVLTAEVAALKTLVLTSTPSRPNPHLHPQIDPKSKDDQSSNGSGLFRKQHRRSPSHFNLKYGRENSPPDSPVKEQKVAQNPADNNDGVDMLEVDPNFHHDFLAWKQSPTLSQDDPFIAKIFREDIEGCLEFNNRALAERVRESINNESICIEVVNEKSRSQFPMKCALLEVIRQCHYRMKFDGCDQTYCISQLCRNRITAVCNFLNYLRYIQRGLVKSSAHEMYWEIARLRKEIALARLGLTSNQ